MTDDKREGLAITTAESTASLSLAYSDGSRVLLTMPKPAGIDGQTTDHAEALVRRMATGGSPSLWRT